MECDLDSRIHTEKLIKEDDQKQGQNLAGNSARPTPAALHKPKSNADPFENHDK